MSLELVKMRVHEWAYRQMALRGMDCESTAALMRGGEGMAASSLAGALNPHGTKMKLGVCELHELMAIFNDHEPLEWLAYVCGYALVPLAGDPAVLLPSAAMRLSAAAGEVCHITDAALADGVISKDERAAIDAANLHVVHAAGRVSSALEGVSA